MDGAPDVLADGKLLWRVLRNLFSNVCKYSLAGTRVYMEARKLTASADGPGTDNRVRIRIRNISREPLNISPDELMERFIRGDSSRHTEGSGLGLNIAQSLTELMGGSFKISIEGDLFTAEIRLRKA